MDLYRYFIFLSGMLFAVGLVGGVVLQVNEGELIDEPVEELESGGDMDENPLLQTPIPSDSTANYGTLSRPQSSGSSVPSRRLGNALRKTLVLNTETRRFLVDPAMWFVTAGFFLVTGTGDTFINNLGTIILTLYPRWHLAIPRANSAATNVSIVAITSTAARLLTGFLSDLLAPMGSHEPNFKSFTLSRMAFLVASGILSALSQLLVASTLVQRHPALFRLVSAFAGLGYGTVFSITPTIVNVVWGPRNFGTNYGIVCVVPAAGAAMWSAVYSAVYQRGVKPEMQEGLCYGYACYGATFWGMLASSLIATGLWAWAWRGLRKKEVVV